MEIILNKPSVYKVGNVMLLPGSNEVVENDDLKSFLANPLVKLDIDTKVIELVEDKPAEKQTKGK